MSDFIPNGCGGFTKMTKDQYDDHLVNGYSLSDAEVADGWHYCHSAWDGLLIHRDWFETEHCECENLLESQKRSVR